MSAERRQDRDGWRTLGEDPDERFTFANERTFLAWNRTALALVTAGLAITQLLPDFAVAGGRQVVGLPLIALGAVIAVLSYREWVANEVALRTKAPLPPSRLPLVVTGVLGVIGVLAFVLAVLGRAG
ncbi:MAG: YidH family protein [Acidimicrobiia bacterium]